MMLKWKFGKILLFTGLLAFISPFVAQTQFTILAVGEAEHRSPLFTKKYSDLQLAGLALESYYQKQVMNGYLDCAMDTVVDGQQVRLTVTRGKQYHWGDVKMEPGGLWNGIKELQLSGRPVAGSPDIAGIIEVLEDSGYPFARVLTRGISIRDTLVDLQMEVIPGPIIRWDSLIIKSSTPLASRYIRNYIAFRKKDLYSESWAATVERKLKEVPFLQVRQSPEVLFRPEKADLYCYLEKKKSNYFNGVLGFQPADDGGKLNLTGDVEVKLLNVLNGGEEFHFNWRKMQVQTQDLSVQAFIPYLFALPVGAEARLKIYRRDSTFSSVGSSLALVHLTGGTNYVKAFVRNNNSVQLAGALSPQDLADVRSTLFGIGWKQENFDYRYNPRKGIGLNTECSAGRKTVEEQNASDEQVEMRTDQYVVEGAVEFFIPTFNRQTIRLGLNGGGIFSDQVYINEMYRLGGVRTIRGFDEESIPASSYAVASVEYRLLLEENANLFVFADQGWYEEKSPSRLVTDTPTGMGAGISFETRAGIFALTYALGTQFGNPILLRQAKIGFGFRNIF